MKKTTKKKTDPYISYLKKIAENTSAIRTALNLLVSSDTLISSIKETPKNTFPALTAKQIMEECNNSVDGGRLLWDTKWYENDDFFIKETCRPISTDFTPFDYKGKSRNGCEKLGTMFNFAEVIYLLRENKEFRDMLRNYNYIWTLGRVSGGGFVIVGSFGSDGAFVSSGQPDRSYSDIGVSFSHMNINLLENKTILKNSLSHLFNL